MQVVLYNGSNGGSSCSLVLCVLYMLLCTRYRVAQDRTESSIAVSQKIVVLYSYTPDADRVLKFFHSTIRYKMTEPSLYIKRGKVSVRL